MTTVLRPRRDAVDRFPRERLDVVRFEADAEAVVAYDGRGRTHRFVRDGSDTAPVAIGVVDDGGRGSPLHQHVYLALLDSSDRALAWHSPSDRWNPHDVARFARTAGLRYTWVSGNLRHAPGGRSLMKAPGDWILRVAVLGTLPAVLVLGALDVASRWVLAVAGFAVIVAAGFGVRYLPVRKRGSGRADDQRAVRPPGDGPVAG